VSALVGGYAADLLLGDPARMHPVAGFGNVALRVERAVYAPTRARGVAYALGLVGLAALGGELLARAVGRGAALVAVLWAALGGRSLVREANRVAAMLDAGDLDAARAALPALAGRDPERLDADGVCRAVVESVAENTSDAVVGALLWGAVAGPAGVAAYRAANTLDAMVGHRDDRYASFGWAAARLDDALSWPGARVGAALAVACAPLVGGSPAAAWRVLRRDGGAHPSPNAGRMEASFAGALGRRLGGPLSYGGRVERRPELGDGPPPTPADVHRAVRLSLAVGALAAVTAAAARRVRRRPSFAVMPAGRRPMRRPSSLAVMPAGRRPMRRPSSFAVTAAGRRPMRRRSSFAVVAAGLRGVPA
jgi:adenosylcobinamide-phosphate synthase